MNLREMSEGELRKARLDLLAEERQCRSGVPGTRTWAEIAKAKSELYGEFLARGIEPRTGLKQRVIPPSESSGQAIRIQLDPIGGRIGSMSADELRAFIEQASAELQRKEK